MLLNNLSHFSTHQMNAVGKGEFYLPSFYDRMVAIECHHHFTCSTLGNIDIRKINRNITYYNRCLLLQCEITTFP